MYFQTLWEKHLMDDWYEQNNQNQFVNAESS